MFQKYNRQHGKKGQSAKTIIKTEDCIDTEFYVFLRFQIKEPYENTRWDDGKRAVKL